MTITYTQMNVVIGNYEIWKREISEGKMTVELGWIVTNTENKPDEPWAVWHRDSNYKDCIEWVKEKVKEDKEKERKEEE